jgi:hypothetical protein
MLFGTIASLFVLPTPGIFAVCAENPLKTR